MTLSGTETLFVTATQANGQPAATTEITTTGAIAALASSGGAGETINTAITTVGAGTLTGAAITGGVITRTGPVAAYTDTTDTAVNIVAAIGAPFVGQSFFINIKNGVNFTQTLAAGSGVTFSGSVVIPPSSVGRYLVTLTSLTAVSMLHIQTTLLTNNTPEAITTLSTVGAGTITAAGIAGGITSRTGSQSATPFTDTTDTATAIIAAQANAHVGVSWEYVYSNTTNATATLTGGTGVTVSGITSIPAGKSARFLVTYTAAVTVTMVGYSAGEATAASEQSVILAGSTSGTTTLVATAAAGSTTITFPAATDTVAVLGTAQSITAAKTYTNSTIKLLGSSTGANTFTAANAGASNFTTTFPAVTGVLATTTGSNLFYPDVTRCSAAVTKNASAAYANVTGLSQTVVPGTYRFSCRLPSTVANGTGGIKYAFNYTTTVLTSIEATGIGHTASAVATQHTTTTTTQTDLFTQAAVVIFTYIEGTMVVSTGGTIDLQMAQNTSDASNTVALAGGTMEFVRIA